MSKTLRQFIRDRVGDRVDNRISDSVRRIVWDGVWDSVWFGVRNIVEKRETWKTVNKKSVLKGLQSE